MFNPQRKNKVSDIFMQQKFYQIHMNKIREIASSSPQKQRQRQQKQQQHHLNRLSMNKKEVHSRLTNNIKQDNHKLFLKLLDTDNRKDDNPQQDYNKNKKKHFNYYYSSKKQLEKIKLENFTMVTRMMNSISQVPTKEQCKLEHKINKKHQKRVRKLPSIFQHQNAYREKLSKRYFKDDSQSRSRLKTSRISHLKLHQSNIKMKQYQLLEKKSSKRKIHKDDKQSTAEQEEN